MKIIQLKSENIKKIKAIEINPEGNTVLITGKNGEGKSSVLDSIIYAFAGGRSIPNKPIRDGESKAVIEIDIGEYVIKKVFNRKNAFLEIIAKDGNPIKSPQAFLNKIVGELSFDPLEFMGKESKIQKEILLQLVGVDFATIENERRNAYELRTNSKREFNRLKAQLDNKESNPNISTAEKSASELINKISAEKNKQNRLDALYSQADELLKNIDFLKAQIKVSEQNLDLIQEEKITIELNDVKKMETELNSIEEKNKEIRENNKLKEIEDKIGNFGGEIFFYDEKIEKIDKEKIRMIKEAKMPITGLSFSDDEVLFNNIPLNQVNSADQFKVCLAMGMALNPKLKVILFKNGSLLDSKNMKIINQMIEEKDYQVWLEKVDENGKVGIVIEDGEVKL